MTYLTHIADRIFCKPLMVHPGKLEILLGVLGPRIGLDDEEMIVATNGVEHEPIPASLRNYFMRTRALSPAANRLIETEPGGPVDNFGRRRTLYRIHKGTALIPIIGTLINRGAFVGDDGSGAVSYEGLALQIGAAAADSSVRSILLDVDSPGGEANGLTGLAAIIRDAGKQKPVLAFVNDMAASAAYGIAAQAGEIIISDTSVTGSIGVVLLHLDHSRQLEKRGVKPTFIYAGKHKIDGNPLEPLSDAVRADLQADVDSYYTAFVQTVAAGRRGLTEQAIRATEAKIFVGAEALKHRVADRIASFGETLAALSSFNAGNGGYIGGVNMGNAQHSGLVITGSEQTSAISLADHEAALATAIAQARDEGERRGYDAGATAAMERFRAILTNEHAAERLPFAVKLALGKMPADDVVAMLPELPVQAAKQIPPLAERAGAALNGLGSDNPAPPKEQIDAAWKRTYERMGMATR